MQRTKWTERKFDHNLPAGWLPNVIERLYGTEHRIMAMIAGLGEEHLANQPSGAWSIKQHIGHLNDLEELHEGRINDFISRKEILRAADMSNIKTHEADHNQKSLQHLMREFRTKRSAFISRLEKLDNQTMQFQSLHPRLQIMMKPVDMAYFTAEHDDHHLASIREIIRQL